MDGEGTPATSCSLGSRGISLRRRSASHHEPSVPARRATTVRWLDRIRIQTAAGDWPRDRRVGVPHLAGAQLVPTPNWRRKGGHQVKQSACTLWVIRQPPRAIDRLAEIRDDTIAPASHRVAEDPKAPCPACANRATSGHATPSSVTARDGRLLNHEASLRHEHLKRGVVEITRRPMLEPRHHRFEHATVETDGMAPRPQRQPVQIDASDGLTGAATRLLKGVGRHPSKGSDDRTGRYSAAGVLRIWLAQRLAVRATQVRRRRGNEARRGAEAGLRPLSGAATRSRQLFCIHMAKEPAATHEASLVLLHADDLRSPVPGCGISNCRRRALDRRNRASISLGRHGASICDALGRRQ